MAGNPIDSLLPAPPPSMGGAAASNPIDSLLPPPPSAPQPGVEMRAGPADSQVSPTQNLQSALQIAHDHPLTAGVGLLENAAAGVTGAAQRTYERLRGQPVTGDEGYQPRTAAGQAIARGGAAESDVRDRTYDAAAGTGPGATQFKQDLGAFNDLATTAGVAEAARGIPGRGAPVDPNVTTTPTEHPIVGVQRSGFEIAPNDIPRASSTPASQVPGITRQGMTETPAVTAGRQQRNVTTATQKAAADIGLPPTDIITPEHTAAARIAPGATYDRVGAAVGTVDKPSTNAVAQLRTMATDNSAQAAPATVRAQMGRMADGLESGQYTGSQMIQDISYLRTKGAYEAANALENELGAQVQDKAPSMVEDYADAREQFAKIHDVEDSLRGSQVDPQRLRQMRDGPRDRPLSGGLDEIAEAAAQAPNSVRMPGTVLAGDVPHTKTGLITTLAKGIARPFTPMPSQEAIAASAKGGGAVPMGPGQTGLPAVRQFDLDSDTAYGSGGPRGGLEPPPGPVPPRTPARGPTGPQGDLDEVPNGPLGPVNTGSPGGILEPPPGRIGPRPLGSQLSPDEGGAPPSPKAIPEAGDPATEALFEDQVRKDVDAAHQRRAALGDVLANLPKRELRAARRGSATNGE